MDWPLHRLEELTEPDRPITYGVVKPGPEDPEHGVKFIRGGDIFEGRLAIENLRTITPDVSKSYSRTLLSGGELVVSLVGNPGHVAVVPKSLAGANLARQAGLVALRNEIDADFVKFFLMSPQGRAELFSQMTGSVQVVINLANLRTVRVPLPPLPMQRRIASILSAYDELMENSRWRIRVLETVARALYREWFVNFRFPGHEKRPRVASLLGDIPRGWEVKRVEDILARRAAGKVYREADLKPEGATPVIDQSTNELLGFHDNEPDHLASHVKPIAIFGDHTCKMRLLVEPFSVGPNVVPFAVVDELPIGYAFYVVRDLVQTQEYKRHWIPLNAKEVIVADPVTAQSFASMIQPMLVEQETLRKVIRNLRRTRDLLLPRLIAGQRDLQSSA